MKRSTKRKIRNALLGALIGAPSMAILGALIAMGTGADDVLLRVANAAVIGALIGALNGPAWENLRS